MADGKYERTLFASGYYAKTNAYYMNTYEDPCHPEVRLCRLQSRIGGTHQGVELLIQTLPLLWWSVWTKTDSFSSKPTTFSFGMRDWHERKDGTMTLQQLRYLIAVAEKGAISPEDFREIVVHLSAEYCPTRFREVEQSIGFRTLESASNRRHIDREGRGFSRPRSPGCMADGRAGIEIR